ncbi:hypothetical protein JCM17960_07700 [Magnetospira thiophila]
MKIENWIFLAGLLIILGIATAAMLPEHLWEDDMHQFEMSAGKALSIGPGGLPGIQGNVIDSNHKPGPNPQPVPPAVGPLGPPTGQTALWGPESGSITMPGSVAAQNVANLPFVSTPQATAQSQLGQNGLVPFKAANTVRYQGRVERIMHRGAAGTPGNGWGQMHIWVADGVNPVQEVSVAPDWWAIHLGCNVQQGDFVKGIAFQFDQRQETFIYAKTLVLNGRLCQMRNDEGFAIWSNQLR